MSTELHFTPDDSTRLDLLLAQYLRAHPVAQCCTIRSPWREAGAQPTEWGHAAPNRSDAPWSDSSANDAVRSLRSG